jgi:hypothetical protein
MTVQHSIAKALDGMTLADVTRMSEKSNLSGTQPSRKAGSGTRKEGASALA